ncbi:MAG: hypothetical protein E7015_04180 [Alphaproteobacteria bacterium]|nr:hypothetical protein [Alphaproteobacteria bacterium]
MRGYLFVAGMFFSSAVSCMDPYKVITIDNGHMMSFTCNATFVNFSQGYKLYYPTLKAQEALFDKIAETVGSMAVDCSECTIHSGKKIVQGDLHNLGLLVYVIYAKDKNFKLPEFISQSLLVEKYPSFEDVPEGGVLITADGKVFCNKNQFEWIKQRSSE